MKKLHIKKRIVANGLKWEETCRITLDDFKSIIDLESDSNRSLINGDLLVAKARLYTVGCI